MCKQWGQEGPIVRLKKKIKLVNDLKQQHQQIMLQTFILSIYVFKLKKKKPDFSTSSKSFYLYQGLLFIACHFVASCFYTNPKGQTK